MYLEAATDLFDGLYIIVRVINHIFAKWWHQILVILMIWKWVYIPTCDYQTPLWNPCDIDIRARNPHDPTKLAYIWFVTVTHGTKWNVLVLENEFGCNPPHRHTYHAIIVNVRLVTKNKNKSNLSRDNTRNLCIMNAKFFNVHACVFFIFCTSSLVFLCLLSSNS